MSKVKVTQGPSKGREGIDLLDSDCGLMKHVLLDGERFPGLFYKEELQSLCDEVAADASKEPEQYLRDTLVLGGGE